jgi:hypothetical protein
MLRASVSPSLGDACFPLGAIRLMNSYQWTHIARFALVISFSLLSFIVNASAQWDEEVLYSFQGLPDGAYPPGGVVVDKAGNLYGTTTDGGADNCPGIAQCGMVFQLQPKDGAWSENVLYVFKGKNSSDGETPAGSVIFDQAGNLYGATAYGGLGSCILLGTDVGCGTVFELSPPQKNGGVWTETVLYSFPTARQGYLPVGNLVFDSAGNLYGATEFGGGYGTSCDVFYQYCGALFELSPPKKKGDKWTERVLHGFRGGTDGSIPNGGLVVDSRGNVYGTTLNGGNEEGNCNGGLVGIGCGTVFELKPPTKEGDPWTEKQLHVFKNGDDGAGPGAGVILDAQGDVYGGANGGAEGGGIVFRLAATSNGRWKEAVLYNFPVGFEGSYDPTVAIFDKNGNLYGTTNDGPVETLAGSVFRLRPPGREKEKAFWTIHMLHGFTNSPDGAFPNPPLAFDMQGNLYGVTQFGGTGTSCSRYCGTVFKVSLP